MKIFRVHTTIVFPDGHPLKEKYRDEYLKRGVGFNSVYNVTKWDMVLSEHAEEAITKVRNHYMSDGAEVGTIWSVNHTGDISIP
jgi:hypothetical protein